MRRARRAGLILSEKRTGTGVTMPIGVTALCSKPERASEVSCETIRIEYCFLPIAFLPEKNVDESR